jgi:RHS repeat-associated protein
MRTLTICLALNLLATSTAMALETNQRPEYQRQGLVGDQAFAVGGIENVNLFSGNLVLTLPIGTPYPVNGGFGYGFTLVYNSNVWDLIESPGDPGPIIVFPHVDAQPSESSNAGLGWRLSMGSLIRPTGAGNRSSTQYLYVGQDAGGHLFYNSLHAGETAAQSVYYTRDGSYLRLHTDRPDGGYDVEFPDGSKQHFVDTNCTPPPEQPAQACPTALIAMTSAFGESVTVSGYESASSPTVTFTDPHGRVQTVFFTDIAGEHVVDKVVLTAFSTPTVQAATYDFVYQGEPAAGGSTVRRSCKHDTSPATMVTVPLLARVDLPDGSHWGMSYNETEDCADHDHAVADRPGTIRQLTLPTGGIYRYEYSSWLTLRHLDGPPQDVALDSTAGLRRRIHLDGPDDPCADDTCAWVYETISPSTEDVPLPEDLPVFKTTRVTSPLGHDHEYVFSQGPWIEKRIFEINDPDDPNDDIAIWYGWEYGLLLRERLYEGSATSTDPPPTVVRQVDYRYTHDVIPQPPANSPTGPADRWYNTNRRVDWMEVSDTGIHRFLDFDGLGHFRTVDFQHGGGQRAERSRDGTVIHRATTTRYNPERGSYQLTDDYDNKLIPGYVPFAVADPSDPSSPAAPWVLGTFDRQDVDNGEVATSCFDRGTGFLKRRRVLLGTEQSAGEESTRDVLTVYTPDPGGNVIRESLYGGDPVTGAQTGDLPADSALCGLDPGSPVYVREHTYAAGASETSTWLSPVDSSARLVTLDVAVDVASGLPSESRDARGLATALEWDAMGRLVRAEPTGGSGLLRDAASRITYTPAQGSTPASVLTERLEGATVLAAQETRVDGLGRPELERIRMPGDLGWSERRRTYHVSGDPDTVSELGALGETTKYRDYDAYSRPREIRPPEGAAHSIDLSYTGQELLIRRVKVMQESSGGGRQEATIETREDYDPLGRLVRVRERLPGDDPDNPTFAETQYGYDLRDRLGSVDMDSQHRGFSYDRRGFLTQETHPERGVSYARFDPLGNPHRQEDGERTLDLSYDFAGRLIDVRRVEVNGQDEILVPLTHFSYSQATGELLAAERHNPTPGADGETLVTETYAYGGREGRPSVRTTQVSGEKAASFIQTFSYDPLGAIHELGYPACFSGRCSRVTVGLSASFEHDRGFLSGVSTTSDLGSHPLAASLSYHANGLFAEVAHGNGVTDRIALDAEHPRVRPDRIYTLGAEPGASNFDTGTYSYDGAGNVAAMGGNLFSYDWASRLASATVRSPPPSGAGFSQNFSYDRYGNLLEVAGAQARAFDVDPTSNRLVTAIYDAAGNMLDPGPTPEWRAAYAYDALDQMSSLTTTSTVNNKTVSEQHTYAYTADGERVLDWKLGGGAASAPREAWTVRDLGGNVLREFRFIKPPGGGGNGAAASTLTTDGDPDDSIFVDDLEGADITGWDETSADNSVATAVSPRYWEIRDYVYRDSLLLGSITNSLTGGTVMWHDHLDHLGTPRLLTDAQGNVVAGHDYLPYGEEVTFGGEGDTKKFTGHQRDAFRLGFTGDDLDYMHARSYSPLLGRFTSVDPIGGTRLQPQSWNGYSYVRGKPLDLVDPEGLEPASELQPVPCPNGQPGPCYHGETDSQPGGLINFQEVGPTNGPNWLREIASTSSYEDWISGPARVNAGSSDSGTTPAVDTGCSIFDSFGECLQKCSAQHFGLQSAAGAAAIGAGLPLIAKPFVTPGSSPGTSLASVTLGRLLPYRLPFRVWSPTLIRPLTFTPWIGRAAGRWVPYVGTALLVRDAAMIGSCVGHH